MPKNEPWKEEVAAAEHLIRGVCDRASGRNEAECLRNFPRDRYFIGNLRPVAPDEEIKLDGADADISRNEASAETTEEDSNSLPFPSELRQKLSPVAFGLDVLVQPQDNEIVLDVKLAWACYYRVFPTRAQQLDWHSSYIKHGNDGNGTTDFDRTPNQKKDVRQGAIVDQDVEISSSKRKNARNQDQFCPRYRKIECAATGNVLMNCRASSKWNIDASSLDEAISKEISRAQRQVLEDDERFRAQSPPQEKVLVPVEMLNSDDDYRAFLSQLTSELNPCWKWQTVINAKAGDTNDAITIEIQFANRSPVQYDDKHLEGYFFDTSAKVVIDKGIPLPFELSIVPRGLRYDRTMWGRGFNCGVKRCVEDSVTYFTTTHSPIFRQQRYRTKTNPPAKFAALAKDPLPILSNILVQMNAYLESWEVARKQYTQEQPGWKSAYESEFEGDLCKYRDEIARFGQGLSLISEDRDILAAFSLTNEVFYRSRADEKTPDPEWRLFQIVFLVSQIAGIVSLNPKYSKFAPDRRSVDIIYFPTGGGKTEAYLGVILFQCFYDRLRGKCRGVSAWTRFPLRLLTLQQTQRAADIIGLAELVRMKSKDLRLSGDNIDGFGVGYFVGEGGSPNEITPPTNFGHGGASPTWSLVNDENARQQWKRVVKCPACRTDSIRVDFDSETIRLLHRCTNRDCAFRDGILPVYIVDNEIYRYLPCLVVGTIDKLAGIGNQRKMAMLFGNVDGRCPVHGYMKLICCQKNCEFRKAWKYDLENAASGVTLFVQDELHLLKEGLGTFDSHYESFVQRMRKEFGHVDELKVIASSATIEAFERQVEHLYGRKKCEARSFPGVGPTLQESFYAETLAYPQRLFVGIMPHNKTILNAILELIESFHREAMALEDYDEKQKSPYGGTLGAGSADYLQLIDLYRTSLTYFLANRQLNEVRTDIDGDVNGSLKASGLREINAIEMTGNIPTNEVARNLGHLEKISDRKSLQDAVLATSMISHGVDVDRFNAMFFYGMPRLNAEYIQASSRVGRAHVGIVFDCFHPVRERDQSHYSYFEKYHEYLGQLVEPVAINRWSRFSIQRTIPGLFMGVLLQVVANKLKKGNPNRYYMRDYVLQQIVGKALQSSDFTTLLQDAYLVADSSDARLKKFGEEIARQVDSFLFDQIAGSGASATFVSEVLNPSPMRSLRDVDEPVEIELDSFGTEWANRSNRS